jgi:dTDP-4-dehydrorhamnose 3,5-epimerase
VHRSLQSRTRALPALDDPDLGIDWGVENPLLSPKDAAAGLFADFDSPF